MATAPADPGRRATQPTPSAVAGPALPIAVPPLTVEQRIEALRPSSAAGCAVPPWIPRYAHAATAGENFWA
jgi:hypothetical protein